MTLSFTMYIFIIHINIHIWEKMCYICVFLISLRIMIFNSIHFVANVRDFILFLPRQYSIMYMSHFFIHWFIDILVFHIFTTVNWTATDKGVQVFLSYTGFISLEYISRSGIAGSSGRYTFSFLINIHTIFHNDVLICIPTNSVQWFPFLCNLTNICYFLLIIAILTGAW